MYEIWNELDADVVRNLYEHYTNHLLDVKKSKGLIREQIWTQKVILFDVCIAF